jgi:hypothetical protein
MMAIAFIFSNTRKWSVGEERTDEHWPLKTKRATRFLTGSTSPSAFLDAYLLSSDCVSASTIWILRELVHGMGTVGM